MRMYRNAYTPVHMYSNVRDDSAKHFVNKQNRFGNDANSNKEFAFKIIIFHVDMSCEVPKPRKTSHSRELWLQCKTGRSVPLNPACI